MKFHGLLFGLFVTAGSFAQAQVTTETTTTTTTSGTEVRRVSQILGSTVQLQGVNNFGKVEDIILGDNGNADFLVVSANGKTLLLPWDAGNVDYTQRVVTYDVAPQAVQSFYVERNAYPNLAEPGYRTRVQQAFPNRGGRRATSTIRSVEPGPGGTVIEDKEKVKVRPDGTVKIKDKEKVKDN